MWHSGRDGVRIRELDADGVGVGLEKRNEETDEWSCLSDAPIAGYGRRNRTTGDGGRGKVHLERGSKCGA